MGRKSGPRQLKREATPGFWPITRKRLTWAPRTRPGPHPRERSIPLVLVIRETLGYAKTSKEAERIINAGKVVVDGVVRRDHRFPVGLMDVMRIEGAGQTFRVLPKPNRGMSLSPIGQKEAGYKLCKVVGKRNIAGGRTQLNLHDGRNIVIQTRDPRQKTDEPLAVGGALQLTVPDQKLVKYIPFQPGAVGLVIDGRNQGLYGKIISITPGTHARPKTVKIETATEAFDTPEKYVIPVGTEASLVELGEKRE
jgi:small subunit ribosomal protein S4e